MSPDAEPQNRSHRIGCTLPPETTGNTAADNKEGVGGPTHRIHNGRRQQTLTYCQEVGPGHGTRPETVASPLHTRNCKQPNTLILNVKCEVSVQTMGGGATEKCITLKNQLHELMRNGNKSKAIRYTGPITDTITNGISEYVRTESNNRIRTVRTLTECGPEREQMVGFRPTTAINAPQKQIRHSVRHIVNIKKQKKAKMHTHDQQAWEG